MYLRVDGSCVKAFQGECTVDQDLQVRARLLALRAQPRHPVIESSFPSDSHRHLCFHLIFFDEVPETFEYLIRGICTIVFATSIFFEGFLALHKVSRRPHLGEKRVHHSRWHWEISAQSHSMWLQSMSQRQDPTVFSVAVFVSTPAAEPIAAFARANTLHNHCGM